MALELPDDLATLLLTRAQEGGAVRVSQVVDGGDLASFVVELGKTETFRALTCVSRQFAALSRPVLRSSGRQAYREAVGGTAAHVAFVEFHN